MIIENDNRKYSFSNTVKRFYTELNERFIEYNLVFLLQFCNNSDIILDLYIFFIFNYKIC